MTRLRTLPARVALIKARLQTADTHENGSGWAARERVHGNRHQRGYGNAWDKLRLRILDRDKYLCQPCLRSGRPETAQQVDHIVPKAQGGTDDPANCQAICKTCHKAKTARESSHGNGHL